MSQDRAGAVSQGKAAALIQEQRDLERQGEEEINPVKLS